MSDEQTLNPSEIDQLLKQVPADETLPVDTPGEKAGGAAPSSSAEGSDAIASEATSLSAEKREAGGTQPTSDSIPEGDVELLIARAEKAIESICNETPDELPHGAQAYQLEEFRGAPASTEAATLDLLRDVELDLKIELGRTHLYLEDVLKLRRGSVVPLDKLAGDPVDIFVNGRLIARGEVLVLNDNFCVRVAELISGTQASA